MEMQKENATWSKWSCRKWGKCKRGANGDSQSGNMEKAKGKCKRFVTNTDYDLEGKRIICGDRSRNDSSK